jgi:hypothetical protein
MIIRIRTCKGIQRLEISEIATIGELRNIILHKYGIQLVCQRITRNGQLWYNNVNNDENNETFQLQDDFPDDTQTLQQLNLKHGDLLYLDEFIPTHYNINNTHLQAGNDVAISDQELEPLRFNGLNIDELERNNINILSLVYKFLDEINQDLSSTATNPFVQTLQTRINELSLAIHNNSSNSNITTTIDPPQYSDIDNKPCIENENKYIDSDINNNIETIKPIVEETKQEMYEHTNNYHSNRIIELESSVQYWESRYIRLRDKAQKMNDAGLTLKLQAEKNAILFKAKLAKRDVKIQQLQEQINELMHDNHNHINTNNSIDKTTVAKTSPVTATLLKKVNITNINNSNNSSNIYTNRPPTPLTFNNSTEPVDNDTAKSIDSARSAIRDAIQQAKQTRTINGKNHSITF